MKKSILIIATVALSMLNVNATMKTKHLTLQLKLQLFQKITSPKFLSGKLKPQKGRLSSVLHYHLSAKEMMKLSSSGEVVTGTQITSYFRIKKRNEHQQKLLREVEIRNWSAKGYASTEDYANKMIALVASGDAIVSKIIISQPQQ